VARFSLFRAGKIGDVEERRDKCPECGHTRVELLVHPGQFYCQRCGVAGPDAEAVLLTVLGGLASGEGLERVRLPAEPDPRDAEPPI
jgi:ribosomal protein S27AE